MPAAHREDDRRVCGAQTIVVGQSTVFVNGKLWSVLDDPETHGAGNLRNSRTGVYIEGKPVIVHAPDPALGDNALHPPSATITAEGSPDVFAYS